MGRGAHRLRFGLDYLDIADDVQLPDDLQERIDNGELFFWDANEASTVGQLEAYGAISGRRGCSGATDGPMLCGMTCSPGC